MPNPPKVVRIFHITAIPNLADIAADGALSSKAQLGMRRRAYVNIAYQGAQGRRALKAVARPPKGVIHDYVPFYFAPRSPMLFTIDQGNVPGCPYRQQDIVHFMTTVDAIGAARLPYVFYDYNATLDIATCFNDIADLSKIDWPLFFEDPTIDGYCRYWHSRIENPKYAQRMETRQAEFLVHEKVPIGLIQGIGTYDEAKAAEVKRVLKAAGVSVPVKAKPGWYF